MVSVSTDGSLVDTVSDEPHADRRMDVIKSRENIFFMIVACHCEEGAFPDEAISILTRKCRNWEFCAA
jgi:hypothetical protein